MLAVGGELILHFAGHAEALGHVLGGNAHVVIVEGVPQAIVDHNVNNLAVVHPVTEAGIGQSIGRKAHVLHTAYYHNVRIAGGDHVRSKVDALETAAANVVDGQRGHALGQTGLYGGLTGGALAKTGLQHVAHQHFVHVLGLNARAANGFLYNQSTKLHSGDVSQTSAKLAYSGTAGACQYDFLSHCIFSFIFLLFRAVL